MYMDVWRIHWWVGQLAKRLVHTECWIYPHHNIQDTHPKSPITSVCIHPFFGVVVMNPYVGEATCASTGPKVATPTPQMSPALDLSQSRISPIVDSGSDV